MVSPTHRELYSIKKSSFEELRMKPFEELWQESRILTILQKKKKLFELQESFWLHTSTSNNMSKSDLYTTMVDSLLSRVLLRDKQQFRIISLYIF